MNTQIVAYLYFENNCREAMEFYHACLGGELKMQAIKETPAAPQFPPEQGNLIMHAELNKDNLVLMASDMWNDTLKPGNQIELLINCNSEEELRRFFDALSQGGKVDLPVRTEFWGSIYGKLHDKFGISWSFNYGHS